MFGNSKITFIFASHYLTNQNQTPLTMATSKELKNQIANDIIKNPNIDRVKLAKKYNVKNNVVGAQYAQLKRNGKLELPKGKFANQDGENKELARIKMVKAIKNSNTSKNPILTLPCSDCVIEMKILNEISKKYRFMGCELDSKVYNKMLMTIAKNNLPFDTHKGKIGDKIREAKPNQYSHLILDYCGTLGTAHEDIKFAIDNDIVEIDGTIAITLNKRISGSEDIYNLMERLNPSLPSDNDETRFVKACRTFLTRIGSYKYAIEDVFNYKDTAAMVLIIVRRIA